MIELAPGEKIVKVAHRHWFVMVSYSLTLILMAVMPILMYVFLAYGTTSIFPGVLRELLVEKIQWGAFAYSLWIAFLWILFFIEWTNYYLDTWIITNERLVSVNQKGLFNREVITVRYHQIQDVTVVVRGFLPSLMKFGFIQAESAGEFRKIFIRQAANPEEVKAAIINEQRNNQTRNHNTISPLTSKP